MNATTLAADLRCAAVAGNRTRAARAIRGARRAFGRETARAYRSELRRIGLTLNPRFPVHGWATLYAERRDFQEREGYPRGFRSMRREGGAS